ncbi:IS3 family transposase [Sphingobium tyrosinilyticum]|uniref:IS3 family transposase n=1 Tax=Sphingobium tyrosinilyticum TaxID=2715436 RepID=A0ABV9F455_9SPHN
MGIARSTYYLERVERIGEAELLAAIIAICDEFEAYGWRRVRAALQHQGICANHNRIKRLMREHSLQPRKRRRYVATTDSAHDLPIFPDLAKDVALTGADQLWVADLTYVAIASGFAYVAIILDGWSRRVVGYAIGRSSTPASPLPRFKRLSRAGSHHRASFTILTADPNAPCSSISTTRPVS